MFLLGCITTADGSSMVRIGNTTVICGIKAEVSEPNVNFPKEGYLGKNIFLRNSYSCTLNFLLFIPLMYFIVPNVDLSPICSPRFKPGPPSEQAQVLSENLNKLLKKY